MLNESMNKTIQEGIDRESEVGELVRSYEKMAQSLEAAKSELHRCRASHTQDVEALRQEMRDMESHIEVLEQHCRKQQQQSQRTSSLLTLGPGADVFTYGRWRKRQ